MGVARRDVYSAMRKRVLQDATRKETLDEDELGAAAKWPASRLGWRPRSGNSPVTMWKDLSTDPDAPKPPISLLMEEVDSRRGSGGEDFLSLITEAEVDSEPLRPGHMSSSPHRAETGPRPPFGDGSETQRVTVLGLNCSGRTSRAPLGSRASRGSRPSPGRRPSGSV